MLPEQLGFFYGVGGKEAAAQQLRHIFLDHRLHGLFPLPLENIIQLCFDPASQFILSGRLAGKK